MNDTHEQAEERPRHSAEQVTKSIRGRGNPIEAQIENARGLLDGSINALVLKKEEFVLDWVLERLKSDKTTQPAHVEVQLWTILYDVWIHNGLKNASRLSLFRKHNFPGILSDAFQDLVDRPVVDMAGLLAAIDLVLGVIQQRQLEVKIRAQFEQGIAIFALCLILVNNLPQDQGRLRHSITMKISQIFRSALYDDRPTKKVARSFAERCVRPSLLFLSHQQFDDILIETVGKCVEEALFSKENLIDYLNAIENPKSESGFDSVMKTVLSTTENQDQFDDVIALPLLLKISLEALKHASQNITPDQKSLLAATFLSVLDSLSFPPPISESSDVPPVITLSIRHLKKLCNLLQVFSEIPPPDSDTLLATLNRISLSCLPFLDFNDRSVAIYGWKALALVMKIDFDVVLDIMVQIYPRIHTATLEFLSILVSTKFSIRNGVDFVKEWVELLANTSNEDTPLREPQLIRLISNEIRKNLSSNQILELLQFLNERLLDPNVLLPLKAVLMNMPSVETVKHVAPYIKEMFQSSILDRLRGKHATEELFEVWFLAMEISDSLARDLFHFKAVKRASRISQKSTSLFPLQCILRLREVGGSSGKKNKKINKACSKSLPKATERLITEMQSGSDDKMIEIIGALVRRWMSLLREAGDDLVMKGFGQMIYNLGSRLQDDKPASSMRCPELQLRALMSSDLYEGKGLIDPILEVLESGLDLCGSVEDGVMVNGDAVETGSHTNNKAEKCRSSLMMALRIPLAPLSLAHQNQIFSKLVRLDNAICEDKLRVLRGESEKASLLTLTRRAITRFLQTIAKTAIEDVAMVETFIALFTSLNKHPSNDLRAVTLRCSEILLGRFATSESSRIAEVLKHLINKTVAASLYKLQSLRAQLRAWLTSSWTVPFYPDGESLLGITVLAELNSIKDKFDESTLKKFEMMRFDTLVQLRDSLAELFGGETLDEGVIQATYLLESLRRLLEDSKTQMDLRGLLAQCGLALASCLKWLLTNGSDNEMIKQPVQEIFQIMCLQRAFDTPMVLCAAFISLVRCEFITPQIVGRFEALISTLNGVAYDLTLQELVATAVEDVAAVEALQIAVGSAPAVDDLDFLFAKLLFQLTRNMLLTSSSDAFVGMLKIIQRLLREKPKSVSKWNLDHLIANVTIVCSPAGPQLNGTAAQDDIFEAIASVALAILQLYHQRLSKKYHLIVRMLQVMVHVFVKTTPMASRKIRETVSRPPPWLTTSCSALSAQLFSRVLTMWTSPPSVTWRNINSQSAKRQLTSANAKTGKAVSKHVPWFMMEYIALLAEYPDLIIEESVQKSLAPGIFALFSILGTYEREMCMGALDGPGRGIFKKLWEDWNKYGRFMER